MDILKVKVDDQWVGIPSIKGDKGDPAIIITDDDSGNVSMEYSGFPVATGVGF